MKYTHSDYTLQRESIHNSEYREETILGHQKISEPVFSSVK